MRVGSVAEAIPSGEGRQAQDIVVTGSECSGKTSCTLDILRSREVEFARVSAEEVGSSRPALLKALAAKALHALPAWRPDTPAGLANALSQDRFAHSLQYTRLFLLLDDASAALSTASLLLRLHEKTSCNIAIIVIALSASPLPVLEHLGRSGLTHGTLAFYPHPPAASREPDGVSCCMQSTFLDFPSETWNK